MQSIWLCQRHQQGVRNAHKNEAQNSQVDGNNDSDEENFEYTKVVEKSIQGDISGFVVVINWDKEENRKISTEQLVWEGESFITSPGQS